VERSAVLPNLLLPSTGSAHFQHLYGRSQWDSDAADEIFAGEDANILAAHFRP
jgi:hypothetical protein